MLLILCVGIRVLKILLGFMSTVTLLYWRKQTLCHVWIIPYLDIVY